MTAERGHHGDHPPDPGTKGPPGENTADEARLNDARKGQNDPERETPSGNLDANDDELMEKTTNDHEDDELMAQVEEDGYVDKEIDAWLDGDDEKSTSSEKQCVMKIVVPKGNSWNSLFKLLHAMFENDTAFMLHKKSDSDYTGSDVVIRLSDEDEQAGFEAFEPFLLQLPSKRGDQETVYLARITSHYTIKEWKEFLLNDLRSNKTKIALHRLEVTATRTIGVIVKKNPKLTNAGHYRQWLKTQLPDTAPDFHLSNAHPKISSDKEVRTNVFQIQTGSDDAKALNDDMMNAFPKKTTGEFFVSYMAGFDDEHMACFYRIQNKFLGRSQLSVGKTFNIDRTHDIGLSEAYSLRRFIREQPTREAKLDLDIENGGIRRRVTITAQKRDAADATILYREFNTLRFRHASSNQGETKSTEESQAMKAYIANMSFVANDLTSTESGFSRPPGRKLNRPLSRKTQTSKKKSKRSYAEAALTSVASDHSKNLSAPISDEVSEDDNEGSEESSVSDLTTRTDNRSKTTTEARTQSTSNTSALQMIQDIHQMMSSFEKERKKANKSAKMNSEMMEETLLFLAERIDDLSRTPSDDETHESAVYSVQSIFDRHKSRKQRSKTATTEKLPLNAPTPSPETGTNGPRDHVAPALPNPSGHRLKASTQAAQSEADNVWLSPSRRHQAVAKSIPPTSPVRTENSFSALSEDDRSIATLQSLGRSRANGSLLTPRRSATKRSTPSQTPPSKGTTPMETETIGDGSPNQ